MDSQLSIFLENVSKGFKQGDDTIHVLKKVSLQANQGEILMIVGPSGSGKTTLLSIIAGTLKADSGEIRLFDFTLKDKKPKKIATFRRLHIGFIFQQFHLIPNLTCLENVAIPLLLNGWKYGDAINEAKKSLKEVDLSSHSQHTPKLLSVGQQQKIAIARALVHQPEIIICDEPTSSLDAKSGKKIMDLICNHIKKENRIAIIVTHDNRIFNYATRIVEIDDGKLKTDCIE
jgi:putative ABC transport system ATP-binding protein